MLSAPAASAAMPDRTIVPRSWLAPATPMTTPAVDTMPSLAPRTPARSQFSRPPTSSVRSECQCCGSSSVPLRRGPVFAIRVLPARPASCRLLQELPRHDDALDLVRALVDLGDLGVAHHP